MIDNDALKQLLKFKDQISIFKNLTTEQVSVLIKEIVLKKYTTSEVIFTQGEHKDDYIYFIINGSVNINIIEHGAHKLVATLNKGSLIGEMKPILNGDRTAECIAGTGGTIVIGFTIEHFAFEKYSEVYAIFYKNMAEVIANKLVSTNKRVK